MLHSSTVHSSVLYYTASLPRSLSCQPISQMHFPPNFARKTSPSVNLEQFVPCTFRRGAEPRCRTPRGRSESSCRKRVSPLVRTRFRTNRPAADRQKWGIWFLDDLEETLRIFEANTASKWPLRSDLTSDLKRVVVGILTILFYSTIS